jgi:plasmid maintenance system antidote protein VapI
MTSKLADAATPYNPNYLLDELINRLDLKNDAALSRVLEVAPPVISKIRHHTLPIGATILIRMHEVSDFSIRELKEMLAQPLLQAEPLAA